MNRPIWRISPVASGLALVAATIAALTWTSVAFGRDDTAMVGNPCPPQPPLTPAQMARRERFLAPGPAFDPNTLKLPPEEQAAVVKAQEQQARNDWPDLCRYKLANRSVSKRPKVVFIGDSLTEAWATAEPRFFSQTVLDRGIGGQTSEQVLLRFYADVIALDPYVVHIMVGANDIAGNTGPTDLEGYENNVRAMVELAKLHGIHVMLGSIPPVRRFWWAPNLRPAHTISRINAWLKAYAAANGVTYIDYYSVLVGNDGGPKPGLTNEGVHPNRNGYALMRLLALRALAQQ